MMKNSNKINELKEILGGGYCLHKSRRSRQLLSFIKGARLSGF